ncbi:MAG: hypothetical protein ACXABY_05580 [Candidatus Thorarchaeota archaeon]|jgi:hypothetical protein
MEQQPKPGVWQRLKTGAANTAKRTAGKVGGKLVHALKPGSFIGGNAGTIRAGLRAVNKKRKELRQSQEFVDDALTLAEQNGWTFDTDEDVTVYIDTLIEAILSEKMIGMAPIGVLGAIKMGPQHPGGDTFPGLSHVNTDGQHAGPTTQTQSAEDVSAAMDKDADIDNKDFDHNQTRGPDHFPALSYARKDGQRAGPKSRTRSAEGHHPVAESQSMHNAIYNSRAAKRVRSNVNEGRNPFPMEIKQIAEEEGFEFGNLEDVENFMKLALCEKLYPVTGPTKHANQMKGDKIPGAMTVNKEMQRLGPKDSTTGQNSTGARKPMKGSGEAPHNDYKKDGPTGSTQQFEQSYKKICPVCAQKNGSVSAYCGACGSVLPPRPEDKDGGIPVKGTTGGKRNWVNDTDGGTPNVKSPYGGKKSKHHYLKTPPKGMKESFDITGRRIQESSRVVLWDMLHEMDYAPQGVHDPSIREPALGAVNAKARSLGLNDITQTELHNVVGMFQQGQTIYKVKLYTGVALRLVQSIANMMGIGSSHGIDRGMTDYVSSSDL